MNLLKNQTLALAGMFQSAALIEQIAIKGEISQAALDCSVDSLFAFEAESTVEVFGNLSGLTRGLQSLATHLGGNNKNSSKNMVYYIMSMMKISATLLRDKTLAANLQSGLQKVQQQTTDFDMSRASLLNKVDGLYQSTISNIQPRIIVRGEQNYLRNGDNAAIIRTLLLAGIRSGVLWHQLGGSKWKLVFARKKYITSAKHLLTSL
ncbi:MAG: high frequency lysogenization protein HflD [Gammaproteobacteria bacterium]|nr:high frequency lysogenization protein HflD [Gammaproteobacteria bacterium]